MSGKRAADAASALAHAGDGAFAFFNPSATTHHVPVPSVDKEAIDAASPKSSSTPDAGTVLSHAGSAASVLFRQTAGGGGMASPAVDKQEAEAQGVPWDSLSPEAFNSVADMYIGRLWMRLERGLREAEGEGKGDECQIKAEGGAMHVMLPFDGRLVIKKDCEEHALVVESNVFEPWEDRDCIVFRPQKEDVWVDEDGQGLPDFVAGALSRYLKAAVRL